MAHHARALRPAHVGRGFARAALLAGLLIPGWFLTALPASGPSSLFPPTIPPARRPTFPPAPTESDPKPPPKTSVPTPTATSPAADIPAPTSTSPAPTENNPTPPTLSSITETAISPSPSETAITGGTPLPSPTPSSSPGETPTPSASPEGETPTLSLSPSLTPSAETNEPATPTTVSETPTPDGTVMPSATPSPEIETPSPSPSPSPEPPLATPTEGPTLTPSPSPTATSGSPPRTCEIGAVLINEVAWAGTGASANDEWIELHNPGTEAIDLSGWRLSDGGDVSIALGGILPPFGYFLLERTDNTTVADVGADQIYAGALSNTGEVLTLYDPSTKVIDTANGDGGGWPGGDAVSRASMERRGSFDASASWGTALGPGEAHDAAGGPILGTPRAPNSIPAPTATASPVPTAVSPGDVWINEVAWAGTGASSSDEWIELHNPGAEAVDLTGWRLSDGDDISIALAGHIAPYGFFLLERTDDSTVSDIGADQVYTGALNNSGERLSLRDAAGTVIDTANADGGGWPAGDEGSRRSMERRGAADLRGSWGTFTGYFGTGRDSSGHPIPGTPRAPNSILSPTPIPTWIPGKVVINEVLPRPHYDWEGTGGVDSGDEYIELLNLGPGQVRLGGWSLDDVAVGGSSAYVLPNVTLGPGGYAVFFRSRTRVTLNDRGDSIRLEAPDGRVIDKIVYLRGSAVNLAYGRLPDGSGRFTYCLWPTPGRPNELFHECRPKPPLPQRLTPRRRAVQRTFLECHAVGRHNRLEPLLMRC